jgi:hypothetical protein
MAFKRSNVEELLDPLRTHLGDTGTSPTYSDETLHRVLIDAVAAIGPRWRNKYYLSDGAVERNTVNCTFEFTSPPVIQKVDERPIVLMASIMIKSGAVYTGAGDSVSWKDEEFSYSNESGQREKTASLQRDIDELNGFFPSKLAGPLYSRLKGWKKEWE